MTHPLPAGLPLLPTTLVGSWSQPSWLIDRDRLDGHVPVRVNDHSLWRVPDEHLDEAQRDATALAVAEQAAVGLDIVTDGEARRESYSNRFANALAGIDHDNPGQMLDRTGHHVPAPRVSGAIERVRPVEADVVAVMRRMTARPLKVTLPGPFTMTQQAQNDYYPTAGDLAMAYADAVAAEIADLFAAGVDIVQIDEPYLQARPEPAPRRGLGQGDRDGGGGPPGACPARHPDQRSHDPGGGPMSGLELVHEFTMRIAVTRSRSAGAGPYGIRNVASVVDGIVTGERLNGTIVGPGADWVLVGKDGLARVDVRLQIETADAFVYVTYEGILELNEKVMAALADPEGETSWDDHYFRTVPRFECGAPGYEWLMSSVFVGRGRVVPEGVEYEVYRLT